MNPLLTIVVPTYNMEAYLRQNLDSLFWEGAAADMEVLILDNSSTDASGAIADEYEQTHPELYTVIHKENHGYGSSINRAIELARGEYLRIVDADDWVDGDALRTLLRELAQCSADLLVMDYTTVDMRTGMKKPAAVCPPEREKRTLYEEIDPQKDPVPQLHAAVFRTAFLREQQIRLLEDAFYVDEELMILAYACARSICYLDCNVYQYRIGNTAQSISAASMGLRYQDRERVIRHYLEVYRGMEQNGRVANDCTPWIARHIGNHFTTLYMYVKPRKKGRFLAGQWASYAKSSVPALYAKIAFKRWILLFMNLLHFSAGFYLRIQNLRRV